MRTAQVIKATGLALALGTTGAQASILELALGIDASGSISDEEFALQLDAYESVFGNAFYTNFIVPSVFDSLVLSVFTFASETSQEIGTTLVTNDAESDAFAAAFSTVDRPSGNAATDIEEVVETMTSWLLTNGVDGHTLIQDISTDGNPTDSSCGDSDVDCAVAAADVARGEGITINAIGIGNSVSTDFLQALVGLNPVSSPQGFFMTADGFADFEETLFEKIERETQVPVPATLALIGVGLLGMGFARRRR